MYADEAFCMTEQAGNTTERTRSKRSSMLKYFRIARTCKLCGVGRQKISNVMVSQTVIVYCPSKFSSKIFILLNLSLLFFFLFSQNRREVFFNN